MVYTYLVTGANRGIGFAIVEELAKKEGVKVIATARSPAKATALKKLAEETKKVEIVELDVLSRDSIDKLGPQLEKITPEGVDFFIGNIGIAALIKRAIDHTYEDYLKILNTNLFGNLFVFKEIYPLLLKKDTRKVVFISSGSGSLSLFLPFPQAPYGISKVALNYLTKSLALDHGQEGFSIVAIHPGLVQTDGAKLLLSHITPEQLELVKDVPSLTPQESGIALVKVFDAITAEDSGKFLNYDGTEYPL